jgi:hypothetical protein
MIGSRARALMAILRLFRGIKPPRTVISAAET